MQKMRRKGELNEENIGCADMTSMGKHITGKGNIIKNRRISGKWRRK
jgi:hypothetical protein